MIEIEKLEKALSYEFNNTIIHTDGSVVEQRRLVDVLDRLKIEIYPNEHPPPHFHVLSKDFNVSIDILTGEIIRGKLNGDDRKRI